MISASNLAVPLDALLEGHDRLLRSCVAHALGVAPANVVQATVTKQSVDARKKSNVHFVVSVDVKLADPADEARLVARPPKGINVTPFRPYQPLELPDCSSCAPNRPRPVVVGAGPAGLFAAWYLARCGCRPLLIEQGAPVEERVRDVRRFLDDGTLDPTSNIQFGEGGAGTFSDGKLTTNAKNPLTKHVLRWFVEAGAPLEILRLAHPHVGSDNLAKVVRTIRRSIEELGGEVRFHARLVGFEVSDGALRAIEVQPASPAGAPEARPASPAAATERISCDQLVLACGHSARHTFELLRDAGFALERKPFSVGVRIEHPQELVNRSQWGQVANHPALGAAEYKLAVHLPGGRSVYTFCMCPGGQVVAAASEEGGVVTNGMSDFARNEPNANAAVLVNVDPSDFPGTDVLAGVAFQRAIEQAAYRTALLHGGAAYQAPAQTVGEFLAEALDSQSSDVAGAHALSRDEGFANALCQPTYGRGVVAASLRACLPEFVTDALAQALPLLDRKLHGFAHPGAVMTAPETRSSSPVRVRRDDTLQAEGVRGVYPCGEGPGYAGGIMSAAVDGMRVARQVALHRCD